MKTSQIKRMASIVITVMLIFSLILTGCGKSDTIQNSSSASGESIAKEKTTEQPALDPVKLTWYCWGPGQTITDQSPMEEVNKKLKETINVELIINWVVDQNEYWQKLNMATAAGEEFDLEYVDNAHFTTFVSKNGLKDLDVLLNENGQNVQSWAEKNWGGKGIWNAVTFNGKIYTVPLQVVNVATGMVFDKDVITKLGIDYRSVKDLKDLTPILEKIKKELPDKTPYYPINPLIGTQIENLVGKWNIVFDAQQNKAVQALQVPKIVENLKLLNDWYSKGYVAKEYPTVKDQASQIKTRKYVVFPSKGYLNEEKKSTSDFGFPCVEIKVWSAMTGTGSSQSAMVGISATSKNPERAMMLLDLGMNEAIKNPFDTNNIWNLLSYGIEGKHYKLVDDNTADRKEFKGSGYESVCGHFLCGGSKVANLYNEGFTADIADGFWEGPRLEKQSPILGFVFNPESVKNEIAQIGQIWDSVYAILNAGAEPDADKYIQETLDKLNKAGLEKVLTEINKQIADWEIANGK